MFSFLNASQHPVRPLIELTLKREWTTLGLVRPRPEKKLPVVLSREEVRRILDQVHTPVYRACLKLHTRRLFSDSVQPRILPRLKYARGKNP